MQENFQTNKKMLLASGFLSNFLEFYDFALFGVFVIPMSKDFFINDHISSILRILTIFGVAFFIRPFGSVFFGYLGDTKGRKIALISSIITMGIFTCLIGCIPPAKQIGVLAPATLIVCRLMQGFALGGESSGAFIFVLEKLSKRRGLIGSIVLASGTVGFIMATFVHFVFDKYDLPHWCWRIPFCMGIIIGIIGAIIRAFLCESDFFLKSKKYGSVKQLLSELVKYHNPFLRIIGISGVNSAFVYILSSYIIIHLNKFDYLPLSEALFYTQAGLATCLITVPLFGYLSDRFSYQNIMKYGCYLGFVFSFCIPCLLHFHYYMAAVVFLAILIGAFNGPTPALINDFFPANIKYSGISISFSIGSACFGGTAPFVCTYLMNYLNTVFVITPYILFIAIVGYIAIKPQQHFTPWLFEKHT